MGRRTTHVLDTSAGTPAAGIRIVLRRLTDAGAEPVTEVVTNADGRCDAPLMEGDAFAIGSYELSFEAAAYFRAQGVALPDPPFLEVVSIRFGIAQRDQHYHVPLLISPYGYTTYRGS